LTHLGSQSQYKALAPESLFGTRLPSPKSGSHNAKRARYHDELIVHAARFRGGKRQREAQLMWVAAFQLCKLYRCNRAYLSHP
jgi:hypothetical protein